MRNIDPRFGRSNRGWRMLTAGAALFLALLIASPAWAWGPKAHVLVTKWAMETLPFPLQGYFEAYQQDILAHTQDPQNWIAKDPSERERHYIQLDAYGRFPYLKLPRTYNAAVKAFGAKRVQHSGTLPWQIGVFSLRLTNDMREGKWEQARADAAALGFYVADAHDPLNTTENNNGQLTGQTGLEARFGVNLIDRYRNFILFRPMPAEKISDPTAYAFKIVLEANTWVDRILLADREALDDLPGYTDDYYDRFYTAVSFVLAHQLGSAADDIGSYWYTAWLNAGKPSLSGH